MVIQVSELEEEEGGSDDDQESVISCDSTTATVPFVQNHDYVPIQY